MLIAIDHGNKQIKTVHTQPFTSGLIQGDTPGFGTDCLAYQGKYYTLTDRRIPYRRDKTEDERFFILTLFAIAYEIEAMGRYSDTLMRIQLAVGLPPAHFGVQAKRFINYFDGRGAISFQFRGKPYAVYIENTACFPQSFSAAVATVKNLTASPKVLVVDIAEEQGKCGNPAVKVELLSIEERMNRSDIGVAAYSIGTVLTADSPQELMQYMAGGAYFDSLLRLHPDGNSARSTMLVINGTPVGFLSWEALDAIESQDISSSEDVMDILSQGKDWFKAI